MYMDMILGNNELSFAKDTYYRFMKSISINWIRFTTLLAANICRESIAPATSDDRINALIIDDSIYSRGCSKKVEMLAVENRESEDPRTLGELFAYFMDEVADVTFAYAFNIIMEIFSNMMIEEFDLNEEKISSMIDKFVSALTPSMQRHLQVA